MSGGTATLRGADISVEWLSPASEGFELVWQSSLLTDIMWLHQC